MNWTTVPQAGLRAMLASFGLCLMMAAQPAAAGPTELADVPLANSTNTNIMPNIMLDLDNSGSMAWPYMPDHVRYMSTGSFSLACRGPSGRVVCEPGDPPAYSSDFNSLYYNPSVRYVWPLDANGTRRADKTPSKNTSYGSPWGAVPSDGYSVQKIDDTSAEAPSTSPCKSAISGGTCPRLSNTATTDLVNGYPERVWCKNASDVPPSANCKSALDASNVYAYPTSTYKYMKVASGGPFYYNVTVEWCTKLDTDNFGKAGTCQEKRTGDYKYVRYTGWERVNIAPSTKFPTKGVDRVDCVGATCTYAEEMANFATWYAWYRTRAQMTKSSIGLAFNDVRGAPVVTDLTDANYLHARVGLTTINAPIKLNIADFDKDQKDSFYEKLYGFNPSGGTPLRASLKSVGEMYGGSTKVYSDPVKYSCQKNFAILATDGYWNDENFSFADQDGVDGVTKPSWDDNQAADTLADVAYYYYHTDLRTSCSGTDLCTNNVPPSGSDPNVDDVAQHQHMTTFTIGLGVDGTLDYDPNYKTSKSGDYFNIKQGTKGWSWPAPSANEPETIDDLWHAAVNGRGTYFSAKNPTSLESGLRKTLSSIDSASGSGAAAATSNLQPTTGDNFIYVATYRTLMWDGEVSAYQIDLNTGAISATPMWQAEPLLRAKIADAGNSDTRVIYTGSYNANGTITRTNFATGTGGLTLDQLAMFSTSKLSQYANWTASQKTAASTATLVNYLRGQDRNEDQDRLEEYGSYERLYRDRDKVLGDIVHAQPIYVKVPPFEYGDAGYADFKSQKSARAAMLYAAANDGMLHAFDGTTGSERWAYIPPVSLPNMWRLADENYVNKHRFFLDGPMTISDAQVGGVWKTILIGAMGKGGRGYYALDVSDPTNPKPLWDFTADRNANLGYSYGTPYITKRADGNWVAVVTSGYNNIPEDGKYSGADGKGYVFVLDLADGHVLTTIPTNVGSVDNPSGLARLNIKVDDFTSNNKALVAYGGDLTGVMWRFDLDKGTASKLADFGASQPIMAAPEIGEFKDPNDALSTIKTVYFGTGRYLGKGDLDDKDTQAIYGIKDTGSNTVTDKGSLVKQTVSGSGTTRNISGSDVAWSSKSGWYVELPDSGERVTLDPQLYFGTLVLASTVPSISECQPGGYSWLYQIDFMSGRDVKQNTPAGLKFTSPIVGQTVSKLPNGTPIIHAVTADGKKPNAIQMQVGNDANNVPRRMLWREMTN